MKDKSELKFIQFDIKDFYPSITLELFIEALNYAKKYADIPSDVIDTILHSRKSLLFNNCQTWVKHQGQNFDVTQGSYDGAEVCELVGVYILTKLECVFEKNNFGLYRDDGLACCHNKSQRQLDGIRKQLVEIFKKMGLKITVELGLKCADFLDVTLDLENNSFCPYRKPNDKPLYIHSQSNHPPCIRKQLPSMIEQRLSAISSNEQIFNKAKPEYEDALKKSGYNQILHYRPESKQTSKNRKRNIIWFNPPYSSHVRNNIGRDFLNLVNIHFPKHHKYHKLFNKNNMKLSYCTMPNMESLITKHNRKVQSSRVPANNRAACNCKKNNVCPLQGKCRAESIVYKATVTTINGDKFYIGQTEGEFKKRYHCHTLSFRSEAYRNDTRLSTYIWNLKEKNIKYDIAWSIAAKASPYACGTRKCDLCLTEKLLIAKSDPEKMLNHRAEIFSKCRHQNKFKVCKS